MRKIDQDLLQAVSDGSLEHVRSSLHRGANVNARDQWGRPVLSLILHNLEARNRKRIVELLLKNQVKLDKGGWEIPAICESAKLNDVGMVKLLFKRTKDPGRALFHIWMNDSLSVAKFLVSQKVNVNMRWKGWTPLHSVLGGDALESAKFLIRHKAGLNVRDSDGITPMHKLAEIYDSNRHNSMVVFCLKNGASMFIKNHKGQTPINLLPQASDRDWVALMVKRYGIDRQS